MQDCAACMTSPFGGGVRCPGLAQWNRRACIVWSALALLFPDCLASGADALRIP